MSDQNQTATEILREIQLLVAQTQPIAAQAEIRSDEPVLCSAMFRIGSLATDALALLTANAPALESPTQQSSVEIESRAKGAPGIKVKAYRGSDLEDPAARAVEMFDRLTARYAPTAE